MSTKKILLFLYTIICSANAINIFTGIKDASDLRSSGDNYGVFKAVNNILLNAAMFPLFLYFARLISRNEDQIEKEQKSQKKEISDNKSTVEIKTQEISVQSSSSFIIKNSSSERLVALSPRSFSPN